MTNYERIKAMSAEEMARVICNCISSDPCDYCTHKNEEYCDGVPCNGQNDSVIIANWLNSKVEE